MKGDKGTRVIKTGVTGGNPELIGQLSRWFQKSDHPVTITNLNKTTDLVETVIIMDQNTDPIAEIEQVRQDHPIVPIIVFAERGTEEIARNVRENGGIYLHRGVGTDEFETLAQQINYTTKPQAQIGINTYPAPSCIVEGGEIIAVNNKFAQLITGVPKKALKGSSIDSVINIHNVECNDIVPKNSKTLRNGVEATISPYIGEKLTVQARLSFLGQDRWQFIIEEKKQIHDVLESIQGLTTASRSMLTPDDPDVVCDVVADIAKTILGASVTAVWKYNINNSSLILSATTTRANETNVFNTNHIQKIEEGCELECFEKGEATIIHDYGEKNTTVIFAPMGRHGLIGVKATSQYVDDTVLMQLITVLSRFAESAIERAERVESTKSLEQELQMNDNRMDAISSILSREVRHSLKALDKAVQIDDFDTQEISQVSKEILEPIEEAIRLSRNGRAVGKKEYVDVQQEITKAWKAVNPSEEGLEISGCLGEVYADRDRLLELLEHLLNTALQSTENKDSIEIEATNNGFTVKVDGSCQKVVNEIEEDETKTLSIAIAENIIDSHGWELDASTTQQQTHYEVTHTG